MRLESIWKGAAVAAMAVALILGGANVASASNDEAPDDEVSDDETPEDETPDDETPDETPDDEASDCVMYAVQDNDLGNSVVVQAGLVAPESGVTPVNIGTLGPPCDECDIEALALDASSGKLYGISGGDGLEPVFPLPGDFFEIDRVTGARSFIGPTGTGLDLEIVSASFRSSDGSLWAFQEGVGLLTIDLADGSSTLEHPLKANWEGLAWNPSGTYLYGSDGVSLYRYDPQLAQVVLVCSNLGAEGAEVEALEFAPNGTLVGGVHQDPERELIAIGFPQSIKDFGPNACTVSSIPLPNGGGSLNDIESLAFDCPVPEPHQDSCDDGKPKSLTFRYTGQSCAATTNWQNGKFVCGGDPALAAPIQVVLTQDLTQATVSPSTETIPVDGEFTLTATGDALKSNTYLAIKKRGKVVQTLAIHTSCSQQLEVGDVFGSLVLTNFVAGD